MAPEPERAIRELRLKDAGAVARLLREVRGDALHTERGTRHKIASTPPRAEAGWWVAAESGRVVGYTVAMRRWWRAANEAYLWACVAPEARGRGYGRALWEVAEGHARSLGVASLVSDVVDDGAGEAFLRNRGFRPGRLDRVSALDPRAVDLGELEPRRKRAAAAGYRLAPLDAVDDLRALHALYVEIDDDMPGSGPSELPFEEWRDELMGDPDVHGEASAVVLHGGRPVALALLAVDLEGGRARNEDTGTARAHRRRGLATLAKLATIRWAREHGIESILTDNAEQNAPMLAINERLGYRPVATRRRWVKELR